MDKTSTPKSSKRVFVVDDELVIASTLATILQHQGYEESFFTDPRLALASSVIAAPDLLLSDVAMENVSGVELAISIKDLNPRCRVLLFSGQAATVDLLAATREKGHAFCVLSKPIHPTDLLSEIRSCLGSATPP